jgi:uncharacterized protein involved in exopolysaccharide biosynthesis
MTAVQRQSFPISGARIITKASSSFAQSRSAALILAMAAIAGAMGGIVVGALRDRSVKQPTAA